MRHGHFATAEETALRVAGSPEGQAAAERSASAAPKLGEEEGKGAVPPMPPGTNRHFRQEGGHAIRPCRHKDEGVVLPKPMPPDGFVKVEVAVKEEERSWLTRKPSADGCWH